MNEVEMADRLATRSGLSKSVAKEAADGVFAAIGDALANGEEVRIAGFGTFATRSRPARTGRNPRTGEAVSISASTSPMFKAGKTLKDTVHAGSRVMTLQRQPIATDDDSDHLVVEFSRFLCDDRLPASYRTGAGKSPEICRVDGRMATGPDAGPRMRQGSHGILQENLGETLPVGLRMLKSHGRNARVDARTGWSADG